MADLVSSLARRELIDRAVGGSPLARAIDRTCGACGAAAIAAIQRDAAPGDITAYADAWRAADRCARTHGFDYLRTDAAYERVHIATCPLLAPDVLVVDDWWFHRVPRYRRGPGLALHVLERTAPTAPTALIATDDSFLELELAAPLAPALVRFGARSEVFRG